MKIGFIGLGNMGSHMARNLIKAGHELKVYDLNPDAAQYVAQSGAKAVDTAAEAATEFQRRCEEEYKNAGFA